MSMATSPSSAIRAPFVGSEGMPSSGSPGVATIGVQWGYHPLPRIRQAGAQAIAEQFAELPGLVRAALGAP